jgi:hypothetical protein
MKIKKTCYKCRKKYVVAEMQDGRVIRIIKTKAYSFCQSCSEPTPKITKDQK